MKATALKLSVFIVMTLSVFAILSGFLVYKNTLGALGLWNKSSKMTVFMAIDANTPDKENVVKKIKEDPDVESVAETDREKAGAEFQKSLKEYSTGLVTTDELIDLIPESIEVDVKQQLGTEERTAVFARLEKTLRPLASVGDISYSSTWLNKFEGLSRFARSTGLMLFILMCLLISYIVALMLRIYIDDSKQEVEVFNLLGATRWSLYKMYLKDLLLFLCGSFLVSFGAVFISFDYIKSHLGRAGLSQMLVDNLTFLSLKEGSLLGAGLFIFIFLNSFYTITSSVNRLNQISNE